MEVLFFVLYTGESLKLFKLLREPQILPSLQVWYDLTLNVQLLSSLEFYVYAHCQYASWICTYIIVHFMQTKTAKSMVGVSLTVDTTQSLTIPEYIKRRGSSL